MKKNYIFIFRAVAVLFLAFTLVRCSDDKEAVSPDVTVIAAADLPQPSKATLSAYFGEAAVKQVKQLSVPNIYNSIYSVTLSSKLEIDFDKSGIWTEIEGEDDTAIPTAFIAEEVPGIYEYLQVNYADYYAVELEREHFGFTVELNNGVDIVFDKEQKFIGLDMDDDDEVRIPIADLPQVARTFLMNHFGGTEAITVKKDTEDKKLSYTIYLTNGIKVEFDGKGDWTEIESKRQQAIPMSLLPAKIATYVANGYAPYILVDVEIDDDGSYSLELYNKDSKHDIELEFDGNGNFQKVD
ncbi:MULTISPECIES: PepSY-like domain-containing protein [Sphingobacterium]|uniref:PepSY-like domain-containing protein n=1 Tax=Sphingobacterium TaxID=28453 RepID=UPI0013DD5517|nr:MULTISPECIES: PepSY-like domain-containing protein [unclassified Sphingobacterium]